MYACIFVANKWIELNWIELNWIDDDDDDDNNNNNPQGFLYLKFYFYLC